MCCTSFSFNTVYWEPSTEEKFGEFWDDHNVFLLATILAVTTMVLCYTLLCCVAQFQLFTYIIVTGYWKTDQNVTIGLLNFICPANSHTYTLSVHCCNRLS